jgi:hypothetical protein
VWNSATGAHSSYNNGVYADTRIDSPIFYDYNDTGYYVDPNSTSNMYRITTTSGGGLTLNSGSTFVLGASGATFDNSTGARLTESYGPFWNLSNSATWHHQIINGSSLVGISAGGGNYGGGNIYASGNITAYYSDERLKTKVGNLDNALQSVLSLNGFKYVNNEIALENGFEGTKVQIGLSAQEIQKVLPEVVGLAPFDMQGVPETGEIISKSGENYLTVDYSRLVPLLIEAIKEQQNIIDSQEARLANLESLLIK